MHIVKKHWQKIAIVLLAVCVVVLGFRVYSLSKDIESLRTADTNNYNLLKSQSDSIYTNVDEKLKKQQSLLTSFDFEYGPLDSSTDTVEYTVSVVPKTVMEDMLIYFQTKDGVLNFTKGDNNVFTANFSADIFSEEENYNILNIKYGDTVKTENLEFFSSESLRYTFIPSVDASFNASASLTRGTDKLKLNGDCMLWYEDAGEGDIKVNKCNLVYLLNGEIVKTQDVTDEFAKGTYNGSVKESFTVSDGDVLSVCAQFSTSQGYVIKKEIVKYTYENDTVNEEVSPEQSAQIFSSDGTLLCSGF